MKLIRFSRADERPSFGVVVADRAVALAVLQERSGILSPPLSDSHAYLAGLPETEQAARQLLAWGEAHLDKLGADERPQLGVVRLHAPVEVGALFDCGLTPRHLKNSAETMMKYEKDNPQTAPMLQAFAKALLSKPAAPTPGVPERLSYYKCNMNSIVGDGQTIPWPLYTSRLDIEPELAAVYGNTLQPLAGFCIFNDVSARDVQAQEFVIDGHEVNAMSRRQELGSFRSFNFSAKIDPVATMLVQNHRETIPDFYGLTTSFRKSRIKPGVTILADEPGAPWAKYLHGEHGQGTWTFYGGHDPEDPQH